MNWFDWVLIAWWSVSALVVVGSVGQPRKPTEPGTAMLVVLINAALIVGLILTR